MEWIDINERLPDNINDVVLGFDIFYSSVHLCSRNNYTKKSLLPIYGNDDVKITHWMPLPTPPPNMEN